MKVKTLIFAAIAAATSAASAASIGISFGGDDNGGGGQSFLDPADTAGVVSQANWTNGLGTTGSASNLINDGGVATTLDVDWASGESWNWNTPVATTDGKLLDGWISTNTIGSPTTIGIGEIPYANYDLYLYSGHDRGPGAIFTITETGGAFPSTTLGETVDAAALAADPFVYVDGTNGTGNYALWSNLSATDLNIEMVSTTDRMSISGIQIVERIPEPSSALLMSLAGLGLLIRRRK